MSYEDVEITPSGVGDFDGVDCSGGLVGSERRRGGSVKLHVETWECLVLPLCAVLNAAALVGLVWSVMRTG